MTITIAVLSAFLGLASCGGAKEEPINIPDIVDPGSSKPESGGISHKPQIMFQIDEGLPGELIMKYADDYSSLDTALDNMYATMKPLQDKYDLLVNIYPTWLYSEKGYGNGSADVGVNRVHPALRHVFDYMKAKNVGVCLEMYSSGIYTSQNGEAGSQPLVRQRYAQDKVVKGIPMDLDCLEDVFQKYPSVMGVRFHELIGSHDAAQQSNPHAFLVDFDFIPDLARACKKHDRRLVWDDHSWHLFYREPANHSMWLDLTRDVCDIMGSNVTLVYANNGWGGEQFSLDYKYCMKDFAGGNEWGFSVQSWWWQEKDAQALPRWEDNQTRWYADAFFDMPAELMAAFTLETFRRGGHLVEYEPDVYAFNCYHQSSSESGRIGQYEQVPDYSGKMTTKRLVDMILDAPVNPSSYPSMNQADYYATTRSQLIGNRWSERPKTYYQTTVAGIGSKIAVADTYCSNPGTWYRNDENRYREYVFSGDVVDAMRMKTDFRMIDEIIVVKRNAGKLSAEVYNHMSAYYINCDNLVSDGAGGSYLGMTFANLERNYAGRKADFFGDPDEAIVARSDGSHVNFTVYVKKYVNNGATRRNFMYTEDEALTSRLRANLPSDIPVSSFIGIAGLHYRNWLYVDNTRPVDGFVLAYRSNSGGVAIRTIMEGDLATTVGDAVVDIDPNSILDFKTADANLDYTDEIAFLLKGGEVAFYSKGDATGRSYNLISTLNKLEKDTRVILTSRWGTYYKE